MRMEIRAPRADAGAGDGVVEATVLSWKKKDGQAVTRGEVLCEVEFGKAVIAVPAGASGTLRIAIGEGVMVSAGETIGWILG